MLNPVEWTNDGYVIDVAPGFLNSGEFHYFRVPREDWRRRIELWACQGLTPA